MLYRTTLFMYEVGIAIFSSLGMFMAGTYPVWSIIFFSAAAFLLYYSLRWIKHESWRLPPKETLPMGTIVRLEGWGETTNKSGEKIPWLIFLDEGSDKVIAVEGSVVAPKISDRLRVKEDTMTESPHLALIT